MKLLRPRALYDACAENIRKRNAESRNVILSDMTIELTIWIEERVVTDSIACARRTRFTVYGSIGAMRVLAVCAVDHFDKLPNF